MTPKSQRIAIAEACGWKSIDNVSWIGRVPESDTGGNRHRVIPDYLNDLNAMHEAEKVIPGGWKGAYFCNLGLSIGQAIQPAGMV